MSAHNLLSKCDRALVAYIIGEQAGTATNTFPAKRSEGKTLPCIICESRRAKPISYPTTGTYEVEASISVRSSGIFEDEFQNEAGAPASDSDTLVAAVFDLFHVGTSGEELGDEITQAGRTLGGDMLEFTVTSAMVEDIERGSSANGDAWVDRLNLSLIACPRNVS